MAYNYIKALHIIFMVSWMAGLFYIVRLFIYHVEANEKPEQEKQILQHQFIIMQKRLWNIITTPAMILTVLAGTYLLYLNPILLESGWMQVKLLFVVGLLAYHFKCQHIIKQLRNGIYSLTSTQLRLWNELATLFLVSIVFLVVLKNAINWIYGLIGFMLFAIIILSAVKVYKYYRLKN